MTIRTTTTITTWITTTIMLMLTKQADNINNTTQSHISIPHNPKREFQALTITINKQQSPSNNEESPINNQSSTINYQTSPINNQHSTIENHSTNTYKYP